MNFQNEIVGWYLTHKRDLPWRNTTDPYVIWLSEVILQQTRVDQGLPYFYKFLAHFPTVHDFAAASEDEVLKLWQGLGYYSRGRNMLITAREVVHKYHGVFPNHYDALIRLKGIGAYTAAAISSFSSNENRAVVDGNVLRVLARYFAIEEPVNGRVGRMISEQLASDLVKDQQAAVYNQAIMEFGALQCKPKSPDCAACVVAVGCGALKKDLVAVLPRKVKKSKSRERWFTYFILQNEQHIYIKQRQPGDIWGKLYDFPLLESATSLDDQDAAFTAQVKEHFGKDVSLRFLSRQKQVLSHQIIYAQFFALENYMINFNLQTEIKSVLLQEFKSLPHPKIIGDFVAVYLS